jgi:putative phosphoribosyl transferase
MPKPANDFGAVEIGAERLQGDLALPDIAAKGLVIFAHGSGSGRFSPRNRHVAEGLRESGLATLLLDLLTPQEERDRANVFDINLLAHRLISATLWAHSNGTIAHLPVGYFGASTGAGAALVAAAALGGDVSAVVSRGGRPDLAAGALGEVHAPTLLIVGGNDGPVIDLNQQTLEKLQARKSLVIVPGAGHLFEEAGTLDEVTDLAAEWFLDFLPARSRLPTEFPQFEDRRQAGSLLAAALRRFRHDDPVVLALPRGGVPVAYEVAEALGASLDVILVRKMGAPGHSEYAIGAVVDGSEPQLVLNDEAIRTLGVSNAYIEAEKGRQLSEIERRRKLYRQGRPAIPVKGRTVLVVDDGIATGATVKAALEALSRAGAGRTILAVPVASTQALAELTPLADEVVCLASPTPFHAVGLHYLDFEQISDEQVIELLRRTEGRTSPLRPKHVSPSATRHS